MLKKVFVKNLSIFSPLRVIYQDEIFCSYFSTPKKSSFFYGLLKIHDFGLDGFKLERDFKGGKQKLLCVKLPLQFSLVIPTQSQLDDDETLVSAKLFTARYLSTPKFFFAITTLTIYVGNFFPSTFCNFSSRKRGSLSGCHLLF